tara:strand:- start:400 stop:1326 length:927 start_codon:yes stop_codon:yes gene_type:complete
MNILITGGAGYLGSELVKHFIDDYNITVMDNMMYDTTSLLRYAQHPNFTFVKADVRNREQLAAAMKGQHLIIPLAALVGFPLCDKRPAEAKQTNFEVNLWIANHKATDQRIIYPCTNSGYGVSVDGSVCTEESPLNPLSLYGETKVDAETVYRNVENCTTFRLATVFGPSSRMRTDLLVNNFVLKALKERVLVLYECEFMRNYVHIADVCRAFRFVADNWDTCGGETFNVGNDAVNMNKLQLAEKIKEYLPLEIIKAEFTSDPDKRDYIVSSEKFYSRGFECAYDLDAGIQQLIKVYSMIDEPWYGNY